MPGTDTLTFGPPAAPVLPPGRPDGAAVALLAGLGGPAGALARLRHGFPLATDLPVEVAQGLVEDGAGIVGRARSAGGRRRRQPCAGLAGRRRAGTRLARTGT